MLEATVRDACSYLPASACSLPPEAKTGRMMSVYGHAVCTLMLISLITSRGLIKSVVTGKHLKYLSVAGQVRHIRPQTHQRSSIKAHSCVAFDVEPTQKYKSGFILTGFHGGFFSKYIKNDY